MAIDTENKRRSVLHVLPVPDGSIDAADKPHLLGLFHRAGAAPSTIDASGSSAGVATTAGLTDGDITPRDVLERGSLWLEAMRHEHQTTPVTYTDGQASVVLPATIGRTEFEQLNEYGVVQMIESRDFLIRAADLSLNGQVILPSAGHRIREEDGANVFVYEVMAPGSQQPWRYSDPNLKTLRVHTKHVDTE